MMKIIIPMAGAGTRFTQQGFKTPKPLITVGDKTLIEHSISSFDIPNAQMIFITRRWPDTDYNNQLSRILKTRRPESIEITLNNITNGASETCLAAKSYIDNDQPLIIYNCDQIFHWDPHEFLDFIANKQPDGAVVLYNSQDPKNSFAEITDGKIVKLVEKFPISNHSLVGFHYWAKGSDFVQSAQHLVENFTSNGQPECYISETYNWMIQQNKTILPYHISNNKFIPLGTPQDVARYIGKMHEFDTVKPHTIFCDLDGTILVHEHRISDVLIQSNPPNVLPGVIDKFNQWDSQGHKIILVTARKESARSVTEKTLQQLGIAYDQLIMGITSGTRYLINDRLDASNPPRAKSVNVITDQGFDQIDWKELGL